MLDCLRCGGAVADDDLNCGACTWPYRPAGWRRCRLPVERLTFDTGCVNAKQADSDLNQPKF